MGSGIILSKTATVNVYARIYTVTYNGNGNTSGSVPVDSNLYGQGQTVTVLGNTGNLYKFANTFTGWCTTAEGTGVTYTPGQTFLMGTQSVTLYAKWKATGASYQEINNWPFNPSNGAQIVDMKINPANGNVIVLLGGLNNNPYPTAIDQYSLSGSYLGRLVSYGTGNGQIQSAASLAIDQYGNIYVSDCHGFIHKFGASGNFIRKWSGFANAMAVDKNNNTLFALDSIAYNSNIVRVYDFNGNLIRQWSSMEHSENIAVNNTGNIYFTALVNGRSYVLIYNAYGTYMGAFGGYGTGNGQFFGLWDITFDPDGFSYTVEYDNNRLQKFDSTTQQFICKNDLPMLSGYGPEYICEYQGKLYVAIVRGSDMTPYRVRVYQPL